MNAMSFETRPSGLFDVYVNAKWFGCFDRETAREMLPFLRRFFPAVPVVAAERLAFVN